MRESLRQLVFRRADHRCEYCGIHQVDDPFFQFHVEHVTARKHGGRTVAGNLALSCQHCNLHKGTDLTGIDPIDGSVVLLFNPREHTWTTHFKSNGGVIVGLTAIGRTTVRVLMMNAPARMAMRASASQARP